MRGVAQGTERPLSATRSDLEGSGPALQAPRNKTSAFWRARPAVHVATANRTISVTPPPMGMTRKSPSAPTPGPSTSSGAPRTSLKRTHAPDDNEGHEDEVDKDAEESSDPLQQPPRKKRVAVKRGWKGWVEGSPSSGKLINLDAVPILQGRRTRSGRSFDAIGVGKDGWV